MTLGELIAALAEHDPVTVLRHGFRYPHSYRGFYEQLAFVPAENVAVGTLLKTARDALGSTFTGWKGGDYRMSESTTVWFAFEGNSDGDVITAAWLDAEIRAAAGVHTAVELEKAIAGLGRVADEVHNLPPGGWGDNPFAVKLKNIAEDTLASITVLEGPVPAALRATCGWGYCDAAAVAHEPDEKSFVSRPVCRKHASAATLEKCARIGERGARRSRAEEALDPDQLHMKITLDLTKDELTILKYVIPVDNWGDPLKDTYELREDEPEDPYAVLATLRQKIRALKPEET